MQPEILAGRLADLVLEGAGEGGRKADDRLVEGAGAIDLDLAGPALVGAAGEIGGAREAREDLVADRPRLLGAALGVKALWGVAAVLALSLGMFFAGTPPPDYWPVSASREAPKSGMSSRPPSRGICTFRRLRNA